MSQPPQPKPKPKPHHATELVAISQIQVLRDERQRREIVTKDLEHSMAARGLIQPIVVRREGLVLIAGERRLTAARQLGWSEIEVKWFEGLSPVEAQLIELEENIKRQGLEWRDQVQAIGRIHDLHLAQDPEWTMGETAEVCGLEIGTISMYLSVRAELGDNSRVDDAGTVREAYNVLKRRQAREASHALEQLLEAPEVTRAQVVEAIGEMAAPGAEITDIMAVRGGDTGAPDVDLPAPTPRVYALPSPKPAPPPPAEAILLTSFLDWAPSYSGPRFNLIHCDFPYGVELFSGPQGRGAEPTPGYIDTSGVYWALVECLGQNLDRLLSISGHLVFWLSADHQIVAKTVARFAELAPSLSFHKFPLIWVKSDNAGIAGDALRSPRHTYELALLASRGARQIVQIKADAYSAPTDKRLHPSTKPEPVLKHFFTMLVDENTSMLDPTCGSGASLRAAEALGANRVLGLEIDPQYAEPARRALAQARALRGAAKGPVQQLNL